MASMGYEGVLDILAIANVRYLTTWLRSNTKSLVLVLGLWGWSNPASPEREIRDVNSPPQPCVRRPVPFGTLGKGKVSEIGSEP